MISTRSSTLLPSVFHHATIGMIWELCFLWLGSGTAFYGAFINSVAGVCTPSLDMGLKNPIFHQFSACSVVVRTPRSVVAFSGLGKTFPLTVYGLSCNYPLCSFRMSRRGGRLMVVELMISAQHR